MIPKVVSWKKDTVSDLHSLLTSGETIAVIDIHGVPASAMFGMRAELRSSMKIQVAKKRLMKIRKDMIKNGEDTYEIDQQLGLE